MVHRRVNCRFSIARLSIEDLDFCGDFSIGNWQLQIGNVLRFGGLDPWLGALPGNGETHHEHSTSFSAVVTADLAVVILHHAVASAQAKTSSLPDGLGSVKRIKNTARLADARASVGELQQDFVAFAPGTRNENAPADFFERIHGIADDLQAALQQLAGVAPNSWQ